MGVNDDVVSVHSNQTEGIPMKKVIVAIALVAGMLGASVSVADAHPHGWGHHHGHRHCTSWGHHHHCRGWGW